MKIHPFPLTLLIITTLYWHPDPLSAAVIIDSATAPIVNGDDIAQTIGNGTLLNNADYSDQNPAQSFSTGSTAGGYLINSLTLHGSGGFGGNWLTNTYTISIYDATGTGLTPTSGAMNSNSFTTIYSENFTLDGTVDGTAYLTYQFTTPVAVDENKIYLFRLSQTGFGWFGFTRSPGDSYAGGNAGTYWPPTYYGSGNPGYDREFHLDVTAAAIPEPSPVGLSAIGLACMLLRRRANCGAL